MEKSHKKNNIVLHLDPRGVILSGGKDVIERQKKYARNLTVSRGETGLTLNVFSASTSHIFQKDIKSNFELNTLSKPNLNLFLFVLKSVKYCSEKKLNVKLIIVGDPWESLICAKIIRIILFKFVPIQVHIHADIGDPVWAKLSWRNRLRSWWAKCSLKRVDAIRTVGIHQTWNIINTFNVDKSKISIIPVPIDTKYLTRLNINSRRNSIAFIGRLHQDRGISMFLELITILKTNRKDFELLVVGSGPEVEKLLHKINTLFPHKEFTYFGQLTNQELKKLWSKIGILVSTSPVESYGRVMREALVAGVPVWATKSSGVKDLISKAGKDAVKILDLSKSRHKLCKELDQLLKTKVPLNVRKQLKKENSTYAQQLANSWLDLINKQKP